MTSHSATLTTDRAARIAALRRLPRPALWVIAARLKTLSLSVAPVLAGTWYAATVGLWRLDVLVLAMLSAAAIQIGTNLWNDAADAERGVDTEERLGPPRLTSLQLLDGTDVRRAALAAFLAAALSGLYLTVLGGWPILLAGILSLLMGYLYSMGPWPLSMTPFGEILVIVFFGAVAVAGTSYLHSGAIDWRSLALGGVLGLPAAAVLLINNHRDRLTDQRAGRRTLAILIGDGASRVLYGVLLLASAVLGTVWAAPQSVTGWLLGAGLAAVALILAAQMWRTAVSTKLNSLIPKTAAFQIVLILALIGIKTSL